MEDTNKLKFLMAKHQNVEETDKLQFLNRIRHEHSFQSVQDCIYYLDIVVNNKPLNIDNIMEVNSLDEYPILKINIIDEAVCSIIYEIYHIIQRKNFDILDYDVDLIYDLRKMLYEKSDFEYTKYSIEKYFCRALFMIIDDIFYICRNMNLEYNKEEDIPKKLAYDYYHLMFVAYDAFAKKDEYSRSLKGFYYEMMTAHEKWL